MVIVFLNPSAGKTLFLYHVLILRLLYGVPTAFQRDRHLLVFDGAGVYIFDNATMLPEPYGTRYFPHGLWCLIDANPDLVRSSEIFSGEQSRLFILQASSPRMIHHDYAARKDHVIYTMKPFSLKELHYGSNSLGPSLSCFSKSQFQTRGTKFGMDPRPQRGFPILREIRPVSPSML